MLSLRYLALALVLLECHEVFGDFGISPTITGAISVEEYSRKILHEATGLVEAYGDIPIDGPVVAFNEASAALIGLYEQIVTLVQPIGTSIGKLALDDVGPVETLFGNVDTNINAMITFINGTGQTMLATIQTKVSTYVRNELNDILTTFKNTLTELKSALASLKAGVISARSNRATSSNVSTYVKSSMVTLVQTKTLELSTDIPSAIFSALESGRTIARANMFVERGFTIVSGDSLHEMFEGDLLNDYRRIMSSLDELKILIASEIPMVNAHLGMFAQVFSTLTGPLGTKYVEIDTTFRKITAGTDENVLNAYKTLVSSAAAFTNALLANFFPPIEPSIKRLSELLVQRGPYADYCFASYYPKVEQYLYAGDMMMSNCQGTELGRAKALMEAILEIIYQLRFFLEDMAGYIKVCHRLSQFDNDLANNCLLEHTSFSAIIPCTTMKEYATMLLLLCKEVDSLRLRLWACVSRDTIQFPLQATDIYANIGKCQQYGPFVPSQG